MADQLTLDDYKQTAPYQRHQKTSIDAARDIKEHLNRLQQDLYRLFVRVGEVGVTDEQQQEKLGWNPSTQRPRRVELLQRGLIADSGKRRKTSAGRNAVVWVLKKYAPSATTALPRAKKRADDLIELRRQVRDLEKRNEQLKALAAKYHAMCEEAGLL